MKETITFAELQELDACSSAQEAFLEVFGEGAVVLLPSLLIEIRKIGMDDWEGWLLAQNVELTEALLHHGADVHADNDYALRLASRRGRTEVVILLLEHGADHHANNNWARRLASKYGHTKTEAVLREAMEKEVA